MKINIAPVAAYPTQATQLEIVSIAVNPGVGATVNWRLLTAGNAPASQLASAPLPADQYDAWTGPDSFVAECIAANMGLALA